MKKLLFIYNPHAGRGQARGKLAGILNSFARSDCLTTVYPTQGPGDAAWAARELAAGFDRVVCCGGDGTLHEVVDGLMSLPDEVRPPLGYIPTGTTNDYARNLSLPREMEDMAALAASGTPRPVDVGRLEGEHFIYVAAFGAFTSVAYDTPQQFKNMFGHLAYVLKGVAEVANLKSYHLRLEHDGGVLEGEYLYGMVSNTVSVGGIIGLPSDEVILDDGLLELVLVERPRSVPQLNAIIHALARQEYDAESGVVGLHASRLHITSAQPVPFTLDGEFGGEHTETEIAAVNTPSRIVYGN